MSLPNPWRGLGGLPRPVWVLAGAVLVNRAGTMVVPFLALYVNRGLGHSVAFAGLLMTVYGATSLVGAPLSGRLTDIWGTERTMKVALTVSGVLQFAFPFVRGAAGLVAATAALSLSAEAFRPASMAVIADSAGGAQRKAAYSLVRLAANLGMSIGPALGGFLAAISYRLLFLVDGATSLAAALTLAVFGLTAGLGAAGSPPAPLAVSDPRRALRDRRLLALLAGFVPVAIVFFQLMSSLPIYVVREAGLPPSVFGLLVSVNTVLIVLLEVPLNLRLAAWPHRRALVVGSVLIAGGFGAMAFARDGWAIAATVVVWTFGEMILLPAMNAAVADIAPAGRSGEYMGIYQMAFALALTAGPWIGTQLLDRFGGRTLWLSMLALGLVSAALLARYHPPGTRPGSGLSEVPAPAARTGPGP